MLHIKKLSPLHVLIVLIFVSLLVLIFLLPKNPKTQKPIVNINPIDTTLSVDVLFYTQQDRELETIVKNYEQKKVSLDSLIKYLNKKRQVQLSCYFEEIKYQNSLIDTVWFYLGKNYYTALGFASSNAETMPLISSAARCFNKALLLNDKNNNAKIMLASCYVQSNNPMLGINMLKEIEKTDSNNILLQMQLAEFSLRSNQLDKAIQRYTKALKLDSNKTEIYAYLSEIYMQKKDTLQSIRFLRKFADKISDSSLKNSINNYILSLNKK